ncbi:MAG: phosphatase PAP2 family protein, partial [Actinomycetota bacterium]|nr:phosphatase PAP2 family protein [Actinomycetota bacterium]
MLRRATSLLAIAIAYAAATTGPWHVANDVSWGRRLDARIGDAIHGLATESLDELLHGVTTLADTLPFAVAAVALVALAWLRGGPRLMAVAALILLIGNGATQLAQPTLTASRHVDFRGTELTEIGSWPSGHATAAMFLALVAILVAGPRLRPIAAVLGVGYALAVGGALVALGGHLPGDVLAGYLVAAAFTALGAAGLS